MPKQFDVSYAQARESLAKIEPLEAGVILPGHGDPWSGSPADAVAQARSSS
jgi:glyoxylase-like metal-dependent hydrolase (beta-lactamase superfamily II)